MLSLHVNKQIYENSIPRMLLLFPADFSLKPFLEYISLSLKFVTILENKAEFSLPEEQPSTKATENTIPIP